MTDMTNLDALLDQIREAPLPARLATLDSAVLDSLAAAPAPGPVMGRAGMVAVAALAVGILGALPGARVGAAPAAPPLAAASPLAPSALLDGGS